MKVLKTATLASLLAASASAAALGEFALEERAVLAGLAHEGKMENEADYEGAKLVLQGRWRWSAEAESVDTTRACCERPSMPTVFRGVVDGELRYGFESNEIEVLRAGVTPWARAWDPAEGAGSRLRARRDTLELLPIRFITDDPLELDRYLEVGVARVGRGLSFRPNPESPHAFSIEGDAAIGWAWASPGDAAYSDVSNPFGAIYLDAAWEHPVWGRLYGSARFVNGFSFSNPTRGAPTAREASVRGGYRRGFGPADGGARKLLLDIHFDKRSFYFDEGGLPERYNWVRMYAAEIRYRF